MNPTTLFPVAFATGLLLFLGVTSCSPKSQSSHDMMSMSGRDHGVGEPTVRLSLKSSHLKVGQKAEVTALLTTMDGSPVGLNDLNQVHTKKIHLLIIDPNFSDYHHEHPVPTSKQGEYRFSFTPKKPGNYRVWADLHPMKTDQQEYVIADLSGEGSSEKVESPKVSMRTVVDGISYEITSATKTIKKDEPALFKLRITASSGKVVDQLEPVMGAYAHIVGFSQDFKTIAHVNRRLLQGGVRLAAILNKVL